MFKLSKYFLLLLVATAIIGASSCDDDDDPEIPNEEEVITNVTLILTPQTGSGTVTMTFVDSDGDGPVAPVTSVTGNLQPNTTYNANIQFVNAIDPSDIEDITIEVLDEDDEHQVFYFSDANLNLDFTYQDMDDEGNPLGVMTSATTGASSSGELTVVLIHEPDKDAAGLTIANPGPAGGETDIEVKWQVSF